MTGIDDVGPSKQAEAREKTSETRMTVRLVNSLAEKVATPHPLVVTQAEHLATKLVLTWDTFLMSGAKDNSFIDVMLEAIENCSVDLKYGPQTGSDVESAFFNFGSGLTRAQSEDLREEAARLNPKLRDVDPELIMAVHKALCTDVDTGLEGEHLGDILPRNSLLFFLHCYLDIVPTAHAHEDCILREVKAILPLCQAYSRNIPRTSLQKPVDHVAATSQPLTAASFQAVLLAIKSYLEASVTHANRVLESVAGEHVELLKDTDMNSLMEKLGKATDIADATSLFEQVSALHAIQYAMIARTAAQSNEEIIPLIDKLVEVIESSNP